MSAFLVRRDMVWLFLHQVMTGISAFLLLAAAWQLSRTFTWRVWHLAPIPLIVGWAWLTIYGMPNMVVAGLTSTVLLASVTIWTGIVFWRDRSRASTGPTTVLTWAFVLWGVHHLDYPLLRGFGAGVLYGVFVDVVFLFAIGLGMLFFVLGDERRGCRPDRGARATDAAAAAGAGRRAAPDCARAARRGRPGVDRRQDRARSGRPPRAGQRVGQALAQVRDLSNLLRPSALDDLGLVPALRALAVDVSQRSRLQVDLEINWPPKVGPEAEVVIYRVMQEALTNAVRHAQCHVGTRQRCHA